MKHFGDITKINGAEVPIVDIITGGSPCQDLSVAGKRAGLKHSDKGDEETTRSGLFMEQIRIVKEMRDECARQLRMRRADDDFRLLKPRFMVWENVPGAFSSNKGEDFRCVLEEICRIADQAATIPMPEKGKWSTSGCIVGDGWSVAWRVHDAQFWGVPQRRKRISLVADFGSESAGEILFERKSVPGNSEKIGFERKDTSGEIERSVSEAINGIDISYSSNWDGSQVSPTLTRKNADGGQRMPDKDNFNAVLVCKNEVEDACGFDLYNQSVTGNVSKTLNSIRSDSDHVPCVSYAFDRAAYNQGKNAKYDFSIEEELAQTLVSKGPGGVMKKMEFIIRRLTPLECERLQGYPDGWTDIGDWVDSKGKKHKGDADSPRYRAIGNSICLPFWEWMAGRITEVLREEGTENPTMASLFDGIGGFPLAFSRNGVKPIWASEIEEFPIAVTKIHFPEED